MAVCHQHCFWLTKRPRLVGGMAVKAPVVVLAIRAGPWAIIGGARTLSAGVGPMVGRKPLFVWSVLWLRSLSITYEHTKSELRAEHTKSGAALHVHMMNMSSVPVT